MWWEQIEDICVHFNIQNLIINFIIIINLIFFLNIYLLFVGGGGGEDKVELMV